MYVCASYQTDHQLQGIVLVPFHSRLLGSATKKALYMADGDDACPLSYDDAWCPFYGQHYLLTPEA